MLFCQKAVEIISFVLEKETWRKKMKFEELHDKLCIAAVFVMFCVIDFYVMIKGYFNVFKEKYFNRK